MRLFVSWSGKRSHEIALLLRDWLPVVIPAIEPWVSSEDITKGQRWSEELAVELATVSSGILCVVPENISEPWLNFEAGALSKTMPAVTVHPFLFGMKTSDLKGPLGQFQATAFEKADVKKLVRALNAQVGASSNSTERLDRAFELCWRDLEERISAILSEQTVPPASLPPYPASHEKNVSDEELELLTILRDSESSLGTEALAGYTRKHLQRVQFLLDGLEEKGLLQADHNFMTGTSWRMAKEGRNWMVANGHL